MSLEQAKALLKKAGYIVKVPPSRAKWVPHEDRENAYYAVSTVNPRFTADIWKNDNGYWYGIASDGDYTEAKVNHTHFAAARSAMWRAMERLAARRG